MELLYTYQLLNDIYIKIAVEPAVPMYLCILITNFDCSTQKKTRSKMLPSGSRWSRMVVQ